MIPPEITTSKNKEIITQETTELIATENEAIENIVKPIVNEQKRIGCKEGEFLPNNYCNKVSYNIAYL